LLGCSAARRLLGRWIGENSTDTLFVANCQFRQFLFLSPAASLNCKFRGERQERKIFEILAAPIPATVVRYVVISIMLAQGSCQKNVIVKRVARSDEALSWVKPRRRPAATV
jgi:hypothetical protein